MIVIVASKDDLASINIASKIISTYNFEKTNEKIGGDQVCRKVVGEKEICLVIIEGELVYRQNFPLFASAELVVFVSRHQSKSEVPLLSVHVPGNLFSADFGGFSNRVSIAPANAMRAAILEMDHERTRLGLGFRVYYEGTHHGPSLDVPTLFIEIGSTEKEWRSPKAGEAAAHAVMAAAISSKKVEAAIGLGGSHCNSRLTNHSLKSPIAFGHIIPSYAFSKLTSATITHCVERTLEKNPTLVLDWKGIDRRQREGLAEALRQLNYPVRKLTEY